MEQNRQVAKATSDVAVQKLDETFDGLGRNVGMDPDGKSYQAGQVGGVVVQLASLVAGTMKVLSKAESIARILPSAIRNPKAREIEQAEEAIKSWLKNSSSGFKSLPGGGKLHINKASSKFFSNVGHNYRATLNKISLNDRQSASDIITSKNAQFISPNK